MTEAPPKLEHYNGKSDKIPKGLRSDHKMVTDYDYFLNERTKRRTPSALREIVKISQTMAYTIPLAGGMPNTSTFPFQKLTVDLKEGTTFNIEGRDLDSAFQYMSSSGYPPLVKQLKILQEKTHGPRDWALEGLTVTCGAMEAISAVFNVVLEEEEPIIMPVPLYSGAADLLRPLKPEYIVLDHEQPDKLREALAERLRQGKPLPKLMYINPTGCNPTGANVSLAQKRELYSIACQFNFLIMEDDPYYYLHFEEENLPSFLSLDVEGRVLRMDTVSKVLGAGLRVGYLTGPAQMVRHVETYVQMASIHTSSLSQVVVNKLLDHWSYERYLQHITEIKAFYRERRDIMLAACKKYLTGLAVWTVPQGGMFFWLQVTLLEDTWSLAVRNCLEKCLLVVPGHGFAGELVPPKYNYLRLSYSLAKPAEMDKGIRLLSEAIKELAADK